MLMVCQKTLIFILIPRLEISICAALFMPQMVFSTVQSMRLTENLPALSMPQMVNSLVQFMRQAVNFQERLRQLPLKVRSKETHREVAVLSKV